MKHLIPLVLIASLFGCSDDKPQQADQQPKGFVIVTPASTEFQGEGKVVTRQVDSVRIASPFGLSPGEVIARQQPMQVQEGTAPGVNISPTGVSSTESSGGGLFSSGGFKWSITDSIWSMVRRAASFGFFLIVLPLVVLFLIPATRPIASAIFRGLGSLVPIAGSLIERIRAGLAYKKPLEQTVAGGQAFKSAVDSDAGIPAEVKEKIKSLFNTSMATKQDTGSQQAVKDIKASL